MPNQPESPTLLENQERLVTMLRERYLNEPTEHNLRMFIVEQEELQSMRERAALRERMKRGARRPTKNLQALTNNE